MYQQDFDKNQFLEEGYTVIKNAFSKEDLTAFRKTFQKIVGSVLTRAAKAYPQLKSAQVGENCDEGLLALRYTNPEYVSVVQRLISRSPEFFRLSSAPKVFAIIRQLIDVSEDSPLYLLSNGVVFTNPDDSENKRSSNFELVWHQDTFFTIPRSRYVQFWGPLTHNFTEEIGTLKVCPGSHKDGYGKQFIHTDISFNHRYSTALEDVEKYQHVSVNLELGELMIFHGQLIHASGNNVKQNHVRTTILGLCHDASRDECVPVSTHYKYHGQTPEAWFYEVYGDEKAKEIMFEQAAEVGEPIGGV
jgi:ectoine hydroxylase-related dioxygenase (phytanoyl-CoA dioxygenase family)